MTLFTVLMILPGVIAVYVMLIRPLLEKFPALKAFYTEANGVWAKLWALCGKSFTIAWSYVLLVIGGLLNQLDGIAATLGDPNFKQQVTTVLHADPAWLGYFTMVVSGFTIAARLKSLGGK